MPRSTRQTVALFALGLTLAACGGGGDSPAPAPSPPPPPPPSSAASVTVAPASSTDWWGYDVSLSAVVRDANNTVISPPPALTWTSSADPVATVTSAGLVTLLRQGTATIRAAASGAVAGTATVTVRGLTTLGRGTQDTQCATSDDRVQILCWGSSGVATQPRIPNPSAQSSYAQPTPIVRGAIPADARIRQIALSTFHACALTEAGQAYCWGDGAGGKLGAGNVDDVTAPVAVLAGEIPTGVTLTSIGLAPTYSCATASNGLMYCWGSSGDLPVPGANTTAIFSSPRLASQGQIPAGVRLVSTAPTLNGGVMLGDDGRAYRWGTGAPTPVPVAQGQIPTNVRLVQISADDNFACGVGDDGRVYCWGSGFGRRFGVNDTTFRSNSTPLVVAQGAIPAGVRLTAVTVGGIAISNCAIADDGNVYCWGEGYQGSLGNGVLTDNTALTPIRVLDGQRPAGVRPLHVSCGQYHCIVLGDDGRGYAWGFNQGSALSLPSTTNAVAQPTLMTRPNRD